MKSQVMKPHTCTNCGTVLDAATTLDGDFNPSTGDLSICMYCGQIGVYEKDMSIRKMQENEMYILASKEPQLVNRLRKMQHIIINFAGLNISRSVNNN